MPFNPGIWGNTYNLEAINDVCYVILKSVNSSLDNGKTETTFTNFKHNLKTNEFEQLPKLPLNISNIAPIYNPYHPEILVLSSSGETSESCLFNINQNSWNCSGVKNYPNKQTPCTVKYFVKGIVPGGPADIAGVEEGMYIDKINGRKVTPENFDFLVTTVLENNTITLESSDKLYTLKYPDKNNYLIRNIYGVEDIKYSYVPPTNSDKEVYTCSSGSREYPIAFSFNKSGFEDKYFFCAGGVVLVQIIV